MTKKQIKQIMSNATLVESDFAFFSQQISNNKWIIKVLDLNNDKYKATLEIVLNNTSLVLDLIESTFTDEKRKYEMLYNAEKHKEIFR